MNNEKNELVKIGGLWANESKKGERYLAGNFGAARILIMKNKFKEEENHPDWILYVTKNDAVGTKKKDNDII